MDAADKPRHDAIMCIYIGTVTPRFIRGVHAHGVALRACIRDLPERLFLADEAVAQLADLVEVVNDAIGVLANRVVRADD
jgi:cystathionine beta-lyase family protein involved in aluminum resistance